MLTVTIDLNVDVIPVSLSIFVASLYCPANSKVLRKIEDI